jgi:hypothetical protein
MKRTECKQHSISAVSSSVKSHQCRRCIDYKAVFSPFDKSPQQLYRPQCQRGRQHHGQRCSWGHSSVPSTLEVNCPLTALTMAWGSRMCHWRSQKGFPNRRKEGCSYFLASHITSVYPSPFLELHLQLNNLKTVETLPQLFPRRRAGHAGPWFSLVGWESQHQQL